MSEEIAKILSNRIAHIQEILKYAETFTLGAEKFIQGINPADFNKFVEAVNGIKSVIEQLQQPPMITFDGMSSLYKILAKLSAYIDEIVRVANNPSYVRTLLFGMTMGYGTKLNLERSHALTAYDNYKSTSIRDDEKIFEAAFKELRVDEDLDSAYAYIINNQDINDFSLALLGRVIKLAIDPGRKKLLQQMVNHRIDSLLGSTRLKTIFLSRYGLHPVTESMPVTELCDIIRELAGAVDISDDDEKIGGVSADATQQFEDLANELGVGIIQITHATSSPIEFDLRGVIDQQYILAHKLDTKPMYGITKKIIERYNTAKYIDPRDVRLWEQKVHGTSSSNKWFVVETINGHTYRLCGDERKSTSGQAQSHNLTAAVLSRVAIKPILDGISTRAHDYNRLAAEVICGKCFNPKLPQIIESYINVKSKQLSPEVIKDKILNSLTGKFATHVQALVEKAKAVSDVHALATLNDEIRQYITDYSVLENLLFKFMPHGGGIKTSGQAEYSITYVFKMDQLVRRFHKEIGRRYVDLVSLRTLQEKNKAELMRYITDSYAHMLKGTMDEIEPELWTEYDFSLKTYFIDQSSAAF